LIEFTNFQTKRKEKTHKFTQLEISRDDGEQFTNYMQTEIAEKLQRHLSGDFDI
jgi:hypothetical protein